MSMRILVIGGAGFIGSHLADELLDHGHRVRALDNLSFQVHGPGRVRPEYLNKDVELVVGDVRDSDTVQRALRDIDVVYHLAAAVGVGQSMYEIASYTSQNNMGTAVLLEALIKRPVERLIVASSMSIYGEGLYRDREGREHQNVERSPAQLEAHEWEVQDTAGNLFTPIPTPETKQPCLSSIYALSKYDQERMSLLVGRAYKISTVALRFFNVYGTRQALSNPYTGVLAIFAARLLNNNPPLIFEDGFQRRDFVSVHDVTQALRLAMEVPEAAGHVFNVGSGRDITIQEIAQRMAEALHKEDIEPKITGRYRTGDIRHCFADITLASRILGYKPRVSLREGMIQLADWLEGQIAIDRSDEAGAELMARGLAV